MSGSDFVVTIGTYEAIESCPGRVVGGRGNKQHGEPVAMVVQSPASAEHALAVLPQHREFRSSESSWNERRTLTAGPRRASAVPITVGYQLHGERCFSFQPA
jgi:hypothetical protein